MQERRESSTLVALRELRVLEQDRALTEKRRREQEAEEVARLERDRIERERLAKGAALHAAEVAREQALEKQLRLDLQRTQDELHRARLEAERRVLAAAQAARQAIADAASVIPSPKGRHGLLAAWACSALLTGALLLLLVGRPSPLPPLLATEPARSCPEIPAPVPPPATVEINPPQSKPAKVPAVPPRTHVSASPRVPSKLVAPKPICDGTDPLCGLDIKSHLP
jgi:hypothetical protein